MFSILYIPECAETFPQTKPVFLIGKEHNFNTYDDTESSALNVPYDYGSVMHYSKTAFNVGKEPTIVTKIPHFMDVIGQRMEFSDSDLRKLNRLYNCSESGQSFCQSSNGFAPFTNRRCLLL